MSRLLEQLRRELARAPAPRRALANRTGISEALLSRFASRERGLSLHTAERLAEALGFRLDLTPKPRPDSTGGRRNRRG